MSVKVPLCDLTISDDTEQRQIELVVVALTYCATKLWPGRPERVRQAHEEAAQLRAVLAHMQGKGGGTTSSSSCVTPAMGEGAGDCVADEAISTATSTPSCTTTTTTPSALTGRCKDGHNGLSVVSADVIVCKKAAKPSRSREAKGKANNTSVPQQQQQHSSHRPHTNGTAAAHTDTQDEASALVAVDSAEMQQRHNKEESVEEHNMQLPIPIHTTTLCDETGVHVGGNAVSATRSPSRRQVMAATTPQGLVVLVNECGSPLTSEELADTLACHVCLPLNVVRLSGGITNELFHVFDAADASTSVVIRVFGKETERVISRESELFYQSLFLRTYLHGANFLVYEFLHAYAVLPYTAMPHEGPAIASVLADFQVRATRAAQADHAAPLLSVPPALIVGGGGKKKSDISSPCNTEEVHALRNGHTKELHGSRYAKEDNYTLHSLTRWVAQVGEEEIRAKVMPGKQADFANLVHALTRECAWMRDVLQRHRASLAEGVCHNDLLSANIMRHCETGGLKIIDFDYTKRNFVLYDIANHFNEYTGLECDYARYFPTEAQMAEFIAAYRQAMRDCLRHYQQDEQQQQTHHHHHHLTQCTTSSSSSSHIGNGVCVVQNGSSSSSHMRMHCNDRSSRHMNDTDVSEAKDIIADATELFWSASEEAERAKVLEWTRLVKLLTLASHLSWSVWSLLQEAVSALDVDFLDYAKLRFARYVATKESFASGM